MKAAAADTAHRIAALAWAGQQTQAIALATEALAAEGLSAEQQAGLLVLRAESHLLTGDMANAGDDAQAAQRLAKRTRSPALQAQALNLQALLQFQTGEMNAALTAATAASKFAARSGDPLLQALSLLFVGRAQSLSGADLDGGANRMARASALFATLGQPAWQGRALYFQAVALFRQGQATDAEHLANEALVLARQSGDLRNQGNTLNLLTFTTVDAAVRLKLYAEALASYSAVGDVGGQGIVIGNLGGTYQELGLLRRAQRLASEALEGLRRSGRESAAIGVLLNLAMLELEVGSVDTAVTLTAEATTLARTLGNRLGQHQATMVAGRIAMRQGRPAQAARHFASALRQAGSDALSHRIDYLHLAGWAHLAAGQPAKALAATRRAIKLHRAQGSAAMDGFDAVDLWWHHRQALVANGLCAEADEALAQAYRFVLAGIATLGDEGLRRNALNKLASRREVVQAWLEHARQHNLSREEHEAHLAGEANLRGPFERLVDTGLRLDEIRREADLHDFLIDEATELAGAERVLLVLEAPEGPRLAGSLLPVGNGNDGGESEIALLHAITPWLNEARQTRAVTLRHGPEGANALDQHSCLVAPLIAQRELLGYLYCDIDGAFGRFHTADRDLLAMLASQAAATLANVRHAEGLEQKVAERSAAALAAQAEAERRAGQLAIINGIQRAMSEQLDFGAIVEVVGEKLREVFASQDLYIGLLDPDGKAMHMPYTVEHGVRLTQAPFVPRDDRVWVREVRAGRTLVARNGADFAAYQMAVMPGTDMPSSGVYVPIMVGERYIGQVGIESFEREDAFDASAVRLLQTVVASLGTALENARLFDETQRLLKETERATPSWPSSTACSRRWPASSTCRPSTTWWATSSARSSRAQCEHPLSRRGHESDPHPVHARRRWRAARSAERAVRRAWLRPARAAHTADAADQRGHRAGAGAHGLRAALLQRPGQVAVFVPMVVGERASRRSARTRPRGGLHRRRRAPARDADRQPGRRVRERAPFRRDAAPAEGDRAAQCRARGDQRHPAGHGRGDELPGHRRPRRRQAARGVRHRRHRDHLARRGGRHAAHPLRL